MAPTQELRVELDRALSAHFAKSCRVVDLERRPLPYRTSFAIEELDAVLDDGTSLRLVFKNLGEEALSSAARDVKPSFLHDPLREIEAYRAILAPAQLGTPTYYGATVDPARGRYWLFLENVPGIVLWQIGELETWQQAAAWLATLHRRFADRDDWESEPEHLLRYDADFYRLWLDRARSFAGENADPARARRSFDWLASRYDDVVERLVTLPVTFIHGEFYASNVLVEEDSRPLRVCPIDWERAAIGPGLVDLAALTAGSWEDDERTALVLAYRDTQIRLGGSPPPLDDFLTALHCCRIYLALQWLGWAPAWSPPPEHRHDWLAEALRLTEELER
jgi:aminoglycoside phosphotransferase (APT) family kinase protein